MKIALVSASQDPSITVDVLQRIAAACEDQLAFDYAPLWQAAPATVRVYSSLDLVPNDGQTSALLVTDEPDDEALGWHSVTSSGRAFGRVFWGELKRYGASLLSGPTSLSVTVSHEILEAVTNPYVDLWVDVTYGGTQESYEACVSGDTLVKLADGSSRTIERLSLDGGFFNVIGWDPSDGQVASRAGHARKTKKHTPTIRVVLDDDAVLVCTPEHKVLRADGRFEAAGTLEPGVRLLAEQRRPDVMSDRTQPLSLSEGKRSPYESNAYPPNGHFPDAESKSNLLVGNTKGRRANRAHIRLGEDSFTVCGSAHSPVPRHSPFLRSVEHVFPMGSREEVFWTNTNSNVASMTDLLAVGQRAESRFERVAMGVQRLAAGAYLPVPGCASSPRPKPAPVPLRFVDLGPKHLVGRRTLMHEHGVPRRSRTAQPDNSIVVGSAIGSRQMLARATRNGTHPHDVRTVVRIEPGPNQDVYDLTVPGLRNFLVGAGVFVHNCDRTQGDVYDREGVDVSNFLGPRAFRDGDGPYDHLGLLVEPWEVRPAGYAIRRTNGIVRNVWGYAYPDALKAIKERTVRNRAARGLPPTERS